MPVLKAIAAHGVLTNLQNDLHMKIFGKSTN
jgi:hypothetical protein